MDWQTILILLLVGLVGALLLLWWSASTRQRRAYRARQEIAIEGELQAEGLLQRAGYTIVDRQVSRKWTFLVDGEPYEVTCRADLIVRDRDGNEFVAEVKTGRLAPDPTRSATRRQLLEYWLVFPVEGVLLVDMSERQIYGINFDPDEWTDRWG